MGKKNRERDREEKWERSSRRSIARQVDEAEIARRGTRWIKSDSESRKPTLQSGRLSMTKEIQQIQRTNQSRRKVSRRSELDRSQRFVQTWRERPPILFSFIITWIVNYFSNLSNRNARLTFHDKSVIIELIGAQPRRHRHQYVNLHRRFTSGDTMSPTGSSIYTLGVWYAFSTKIHEVKNK